MMERSKTQYLDSTAQLSSAGLIIRQKEPRNLESPFDQIESYLTPTELFYIRSHFPIPGLDRATYQLRVDGAVRHPFALSYEELRSMRSETRVATLECAGNSRVFLVPQVQGAGWGECARTLCDGYGQVAGGSPGGPHAVSPLLADIGLCVVGLHGWEASASPAGRTTAQVRNLSTACLREASPEPYLLRFRRCM